MTLYKMADEQLELYALLSSGEFVDDDGVVDAGLQAVMRDMDGDIEKKVIALAVVYKQLKAEGDMFEAEQKRLKKNADARFNGAERIKKYLDDQLKRLGKTKIVDTCASITYKASKSVQFTDESIIPDKYITYEPKISKTAIKADIDAGVDVPGAYVAENQNIQIK